MPATLTHNTVFIPATDSFGELTLRPVRAFPRIDIRIRNMAIAVAFVSAVVAGVGGLMALDRAAYAQHDSDPYVYLTHGA